MIYNMPPKRILVTDDEEDICTILQYNLRNEGFEVDTASSAEEALRMDPASYDLILLDIMMGSISGLELARVLRAAPRTSRLPIIFITAKDTVDDRIEGLAVGADDYISKPFSVKEAVLRVKAVLRRTEPQQEQSQTLKFEELAVDLAAKKVTVDGQDVSLTKTEYGILCLLLSHTGRVFSREDIIREVWPDDTVVLDRTVDVNIVRLRKKIDPYGSHITTNHGFGYSFS